MNVIFDASIFGIDLFLKAINENKLIKQLTKIKEAAKRLYFCLISSSLFFSSSSWRLLSSLLLMDEDEEVELWLGRDFVFFCELLVLLVGISWLLFLLTPLLEAKCLLS